MNRLLPFAVALLAVLAASGASAQCDIAGTIAAAPSADPLLPAWEYTLTVTWDTGTQYAVSHIDLLLDEVGGTCMCSDFSAALTRVNPAGASGGSPGACSVTWDSFLECRGDPSIPGVDGILLKFEPRAGACEPGTVGTGTFVFHSDLAPVPVDENIISMTDKFGLNYCFGTLTGVFPGMACNPVPNAVSTWGAVKGMYR